MIPETVDEEVLENALNMVNTILCTMAVPSEKIDEDRKNMIVQAVKKVFKAKRRKAVVDDVESSKEKNRKKRASLFETAGGVAGQELNPDQVQRRQTLLGN